MRIGGERRVLLLLALASVPFAFVNTLFSQTVSFAADEFARSDADIGLGAAVVRWGVVIVPPIALAADRLGRRTVLVAAAWTAPLVAALGAVAPNFALLVASQAVARPLALVINVMILVVLTEEMSSESRARSVGYVAIAGSLGAGVAVGGLPLAEVATGGWRSLYLLSLVFLPVAFVLQRGMRETERFVRVHSADAARAVAGRADAPDRMRAAAGAARLSRSRLSAQMVAAFLTSVFIGSASVYLVNYLRDVRDYDALRVSVFTIVTATPAGIGLVVGGRIADERGRRILGAVSLALGSALVVVSYSVAGRAMWFAEIAGGILLGVSYPALAVYRGEMFPTAHRGTGAATVTASGLVGGSFGLIACGRLLDAGWSYSSVMALLALAPVAVAVLVVVAFPETAHRELEEISPDAVGA
jgi:MFS family permease